MPVEDSAIQLNGGLDTRSADGACGPGWFRLLINVDGSEPFQMCCLGGHQRRMRDAACYNNQDLHDQMVESGFYSLPYTGTRAEYTVQTGTTYPAIPIYTTFPAIEVTYCGQTLYLNKTCRESITYLQSVTSLSGARKLMAGTHSRLYVSDDRGGNWRVIADGLGGACVSDAYCDCSPVRIKSATSGNYTLFTNNVDPVMFWLYGDGPDGCYHWSADYVPDLQQLNVTRAAGVVEYGGITILYDVRMDGQDYPGRFLWSDYNEPLSFIPGGESVAGYHDFGRGERILWVGSVGGRLRIITTGCIWDAVIVSDSRTFSFVERYRPAPGAKSALPLYRHTICSNGKAVFWMGADELYVMSEHDTEPQIQDWLHRASGVVFKGLDRGWTCGDSSIPAYSEINRSACDSAVAGWSELGRCWILSWPTGTDVCPSVSLWMWPDTRKSTIVDYGMTAIAEHQPDDRESWRDFIGRMGVCDPANSLIAKEGASCPITFQQVEYVGLWNAEEDMSQPMDPNSFAAIFCGMCMADLCRACESEPRLLYASASDKTIKEYTPDEYAREELIDSTSYTFPDPDVGEYQDRQYRSVIQSDASMDGPPISRIFRRANVGHSLDDTLETPTLCMSVAGSFSASCLEWEVQSQPLICTTEGASRRAGRPTTFTFYTEGIWLAWRLTIQATGWCANQLTTRVEPAGCW